jgi:CheY-like chemotaxis protein
LMGADAAMRLQSLVLCADEKILRVLRRVLSDLEISIDHCTDSDAAIHKLTRQRFEAVIVDCTSEQVASQVLRAVRSAPCNKRAVAVAILDGEKAVKSAFELGAHFVLYKPISTEKAKTSFRAARALMKRERRRNSRLPVEIPVTVSFQGGEGQQRTVTSDISEGGFAVQPAPVGNAGGMKVIFTLPVMDYKIECDAEVAWANSTRQAGIRFKDLAIEDSNQLKAWLESQTPDLDADDPPVACKLTDLSPAAAYLETTAPFPVRTRISMSLPSVDAKVQVLGLVRVAHPEFGMGVELLQATPAHQEQLQKFIHALMNAGAELPEIMVQPEGLEDEDKFSDSVGGTASDPLLSFFRHKSSLPHQTFLAELRSHRGAAVAAPA